VRIKPVLLNLALAVAGVLVALGALELLLRAVPSLLPEEAQLRVHWHRMLDADTAQTVADPYLGFLYPAGSRADMQQTDLRFSYRMDSRGFRNQGPWPDRADIVVVGDSWVFSYGVNDSEAWPGLLERELRAGRVLNLGLSGFAPEQYTRVYEKLGIPLRPRVLLYGLFPGNDIRDSRDFEEWVEAGGPGNYNLWRTAGRLRQLDVPILGRSYVALLLKETWRNRNARFGGRTVTWGDGRKLRLTGGLYQDDAEHARPGDPDFERALAAVDRARDLAAAQGTHLLVLLFPTKEEIYLPLIGQPTPAPLAPFVPELRRRGIPLIDFTGPFTEQARAGRSIYFELDPHPNQAGYRLIADTVAAYLRSHAAELQLEELGAPGSHITY
jgi:lysophospholipase L1-like esterase